MHSFNDWPERYGKSNPEYFAVQSTGHRLTETGSMGGHVYFSNPDVLRQTIAAKQSEFDETPWRRYSPIMPGGTRYPPRRRSRAGDRRRGRALDKRSPRE